MTIRQLEKQCDKEIQEACTKYTLPKLIDVTIAIHEKYTGLIAAERKKEPPIADLEGWGEFIYNHAIKPLPQEGAHDISDKKLHVHAGRGGSPRG